MTRTNEEENKDIILHGVGKTLGVPPEFYRGRSSKTRGYVSV
jgi:hypothetical protein